MAPSRAILRSGRQVNTQNILAHVAQCGSKAYIASGRRSLSTAASSSTSSSTTTSQGDSTSPSPKPPRRLKPLTASQRAFLSSALRVNQAGELAATLIYSAQTPLIVAREPRLRPLMAHMAAQEAGHKAVFDALVARHRVRPTALYPVWSAAASALGWATAALGREAAMACTEAVETEIGAHYNSQIRELLEMVAQWEAEGYEVGEEVGKLLGTLRRIRDEELEHLDQAVENDAKMANPHAVLTGVIRAGCRGAIWVSERV